MVHASISAAAGRIRLDPAWNEIELVKMIPGSGFTAKTSEWTVPLTWASMIQLRNMFRDNFTYGQDLIDWTWTVRQERVDLSLELRNLIEWSESHLLPEAAYDSSLDDDLMGFQVAGVNWMCAAGSGLLGDEMGVGKTPQALAFIRRKWALPACIICPNRTKWHWAKRVPRWLPGAVPYVLDGGTVARRKMIAQAKEDPHAVVIINYESVRSFSRLAPYGNVKLKRCRECDPRHGDDIRPTQCHVHEKELNGFGFTAVIMDEIHRAGDPKTLTTRAVWAVAHDPSVQYRWGLTGTPDNIKRLWSIMHAVDPAEYPTRSKWMERYALTGWNAFGGQDVVGIRPDTREELYRILDPRFRRMIKSVVLPQLPPVTRTVYTAELTPAQRKSYDELENRLLTVLPNGQTLLAQNKLVARTRQMQFAQGGVDVEKPDEDDISTWKVRIHEPSPKMDALDEVLDDIDPARKFVVACEYRDVVDMVAQRLAARDIRHYIIIGGTHPQVAEEACEALKSGQTRSIVFTIKSGGTGLDMSGANLMINVQRSWSFIENVQTEGRVHRIGSEVYGNVDIIDIIMRNTREERQVEVLYQKLEQFEEIARDRQQATNELVRTPPTSARFLELVGILDSLNTRIAKLLEQDDLEQYEMMEEL